MDMKIFSWDQVVSGDFPEDWKNIGCSIAVGSFDGMHLGHKALVDAVKKNIGMVPGIVTFNSSCRFSGGGRREDVCSINQKLKCADNLSLSFAIVIDFSSDFAKMEGSVFMDTLVDKCGMKCLVEGQDFCCGYKGAMDMKALELYSQEKGIKLTVVDDVMYDGQRVSSSRIRGVISKGDFRSANEMLGRPFSFDCSGVDFTSLPGSGLVSLELGGCTQVLPESGEFKVSLVFEDGFKTGTACSVVGNGASGTGSSKDRRLLFALPSGRGMSGIDEIIFFE